MGENNTIQSISREFINTIQDFSQYLSHQKGLGNADFCLSRISRETMNTWGKPRVTSPPFLFQGPENVKLFFVDSEGSFFKGEAGALLAKILTAMQMTQDSVFICNAADAGAVHARIKKIAPKVVITLGERAGQLLLNISSPLEQFQGRFHAYEGVPVMPTFHPAALLSQPILKRKVWEDMQQVMQISGPAI